MDASLFAKFNDSFDIEGLKHDAANAGKRDRVDVPVGDYEVAIAKLELGESKAGLPQMKVWFKVLTGEYTGQFIFMNQNVSNGMQIRIANDFLKSLESGVDVDFEDFMQYGGMIESVYHAIDGQFEYQLAYGENDKGYKTFEIVQKFVKV